MELELEHLQINPRVEYTLAGFASDKGNGKLVIIINIITKEVFYEIRKDNGSGNKTTLSVPTIEEAIFLYNGMIPTTFKRLKQNPIK